MPEVTYTLTEAEYLALKRRSMEATRLEGKLAEQEHINDDLNDRIGSLQDESCEYAAEADRLRRKYGDTVEVLQSVVERTQDEAVFIMGIKDVHPDTLVAFQGFYADIMERFRKYADVVDKHGAEPDDVLTMGDGFGSLDAFMGFIAALAPDVVAIKEAM